MNIALGKRHVCFSQYLHFPAHGLVTWGCRAGSAVQADGPARVHSLVPRLIEELGSLQGDQKYRETRLVLSWQELVWAGPASRCTLCMAASHAVDCLLLAFASSQAVSFSWVMPSAPGVVYCRDMPVARALLPGVRPGKKAQRGPQAPKSPSALM